MFKEKIILMLVGGSLRNYWFFFFKGIKLYSVDNFYINF